MKPNILVLTSRFPFPLEKGDKLRVFHQIKCLSNHFNVFLFSISEEDVHQTSLEQLKPYVSDLMVYKKSRIENLQFNRLGLIVSKKNGNAVRRNRIKRILRDLYRKSNLKEVEVAYDFLLIINIPRNKPIVDYREYLESHFLKLINRFEKRLFRDKEQNKLEVKQ